MCDSTYSMLGWHDTRGAIATHTKTIHDERVQKQFIAARKKIIEDRSASAASGLKVVDSPSGRKCRATVLSTAGVRKAASEIKSYAKHGRRLKAPERAFVELHCWGVELDGKLDLSLAVEHNGVKGIWRTHGRKGVHIEEAFEEVGYEESHLEADDEGPLGAERMESRRALLKSSMAHAEENRAGITVEGRHRTRWH